MMKLRQSRFVASCAMKISVAIPTYKRPDDIRKCIASVAAQSLPPTEVLVIDDDELPEALVSELRDAVEDVGVEFIYHRKNHSLEPRGLSVSRHIALNNAVNDVLIIDDDIVLDEDCLKWMSDAHESGSMESTIAIAGVIRNNCAKGRGETMFNRLFGLGAGESWDVTDYGFQVWDDFLKERTQGNYGHGGFSLFNRQAALAVGFPPFQGGRPGLEDVYFALRAKKMGLHYMIEPRATCMHYHSSGGRDGEYGIGFQESQNRKVIFRDLCSRSFGNRIRFVWANIGWILRQFMARHFAKGLGMVRGLIEKKHQGAS